MNVVSTVVRACAEIGKPILKQGGSKYSSTRLRGNWNADSRVVSCNRTENLGTLSPIGALNWGQHRTTTYKVRHYCQSVLSPVKSRVGSEQPVQSSGSVESSLSGVCYWFVDKCCLCVFSMNCRKTVAGEWLRPAYRCMISARYGKGAVCQTIGFYHLNDCRTALLLGRM